MPKPRNLNLFLIAVLTFQMSACGTILYPERRNQTTGRIDVGIALLDGFWLLVGVIPGIVAFAVDFSTGAIYLPDSGFSYIDQENYRVVHMDPEHMSKDNIEEVLKRELGNEFQLSDERLEISRIRNFEELSTLK